MQDCLGAGSLGSEQPINKGDARCQSQTIGDWVHVFEIVWNVAMIHAAVAMIIYYDPICITRKYTFIYS